MLYTSDEAGPNAIYIRPFPDVNGGKWRVSGASVGNAPRWRADGKEIFYADESGRIIAVPVTLGDQSLELGLPQVLFQSGGLGRAQYEVSRDGTRLLVPVGAQPAWVTYRCQWCSIGPLSSSGSNHAPSQIAYVVTVRSAVRRALALLAFRDERAVRLTESVENFSRLKSTTWRWWNATALTARRRDEDRHRLRHDSQRAGRSACGRSSLAACRVRVSPRVYG